MTLKVAELVLGADKTKTFTVAHLLSGEQIWGVETYVYNLIQTLKNHAVDAHVICSSDGIVCKKFSDANISTHVVAMPGYLDINSAMILAQVLRERNVDIIHAHLGLDSFLGVIASRILRIPIVLSVHFDEPAYVNANLVSRKIWQCVQTLKDTQISHFFPITDHVAQRLNEREFVPKRKITVVHPGIEPFTVEPAQKVALRRQWQIEDDDVLFVGIGRLEKEKNFSCLLKAMHLSKAGVNKPSTKLWIAGAGSQETHLANLINEFKLNNVVQLLGYRTDVRDLLAAGDAFVLPSIAEPFGMAAVEAMYAGLPVIGTQGPGLATIVGDGSTGFLVEPNSAQELADAISTLSADKQLRDRFGQEGRRKAEKSFSSAGMGANILRVYKDLLHSHSSV